MLRATIRLLVSRKMRNIDDRQWAAFMSLPSHREKYRDQNGCLPGWMAESVSEVKELTNWNDGEGSLEGIFCRVGLYNAAPHPKAHDVSLQIMLNIMGQERASSQTCSVSLDPLVATINHSCDPNTIVFSESSTIEVRSLRPIGKDEEITIEYCDGIMGYDLRQKALRSDWFFDCKCMTHRSLFL